MAEKYIKKIGLGICVFDGTESLVNIISEIRDLVDYVVIGYQSKSYHGDPISIIDLNEMKRLRDEDKLVDKLYEIELDPTKHPRVQETDKRNALIQDIQDNGCSHALIIDGDEFYTHKSFKAAIDEIEKNKYQITYCKYLNYFHDYQHYLVYPFDEMHVPFISEVKYRFAFNSDTFNKPSDPTRRYLPDVIGEISKTDKNGNIIKIAQYDTKAFHILDWKIVKMHHLSWIRDNIRKKLNNWSSKTLFPNFNRLIDQAVIAYENFDKDNSIKFAKLLFNTPNNEIEIEKLPRQYIFPKYDIATRLRPAYQKKKILVLIMSANIDFFKNSERYIRETYAKSLEKYDINYLFVRGSGDINGQCMYDEKNHLITVNANDDVPLIDKNIKAFEFINNVLKIKYDYLVRTNTSTWINAGLLDKFLGYLDTDESIYTGKCIIGEFNRWKPYASGNSIILTRKHVDILINVSKNTEAQKLYMYRAADDAIFGIFQEMYYNSIGSTITDRIHSIGIYNDMYSNILKCEYDTSIYENNIFIQIKNYFYDESMKPIKDKTYHERIDEYDKIVQVNSIFDNLKWDDSKYEECRNNIMNNIDTCWVKQYFPTYQWQDKEEYMHYQVRPEQIKTKAECL